MRRTTPAAWYILGARVLFFRICGVVYPSGHDSWQVKMHGALSAFENENKKESLNRGSTWGQAPNCDRGPVCGPVLIAPVIQNIIWGRNIFFFFL